MAFSCRLSSQIPDGLIDRRFDESNDIINIYVQASSDRGRCPSCNAVSDRVHSRYVRKVADLPCSGVNVQLRISTRRLVCQTTFCRRKIFAERFDDGVYHERSRLTARLDTSVHHLGLALGGRSAAALAKRLMIPVSNDTLIHTSRRTPTVRNETIDVAGVEDWPFRRNHRHGTIVIDLETREIVKLLPDREITMVSTFLARHPEIKFISLDRGGDYCEATTKALPHAVQVTDRWHLMENASAALLDTVRSMRAIRAARRLRRSGSRHPGALQGRNFPARGNYRPVQIKACQIQNCGARSFSPKKVRKTIGNVQKNYRREPSVSIALIS